jgi:hypothetical protein
VPTSPTSLLWDITHWEFGLQIPSGSYSKNVGGWQYLLINPHIICFDILKGGLLTSEWQAMCRPYYIGLSPFWVLIMFCLFVIYSLAKAVIFLKKERYLYYTFV